LCDFIWKAKDKASVKQKKMDYELLFINIKVHPVYGLVKKLKPTVN
jgi:hypothetical protein